MSLPLAEFISHIIHVIPSDKMTAKNDLQTEHVHNHYANMSVQYTAIFHGYKNYNFLIKNLIFFLFLLKT